MPAVDLSRFEVDPKIIKLVPADMAAEGEPSSRSSARAGRLTVAMADPTNNALIDDLRFGTAAMTCASGSSRGSTPSAP